MTALRYWAVVFLVVFFCAALPKGVAAFLGPTKMNHVGLLKHVVVLNETVKSPTSASARHIFKDRASPICMRQIIENNGFNFGKIVRWDDNRFLATAAHRAVYFVWRIFDLVKVVIYSSHYGWRFTSIFEPIFLFAHCRFLPREHSGDLVDKQVGSFYCRQGFGAFTGSFSSFFGRLPQSLGRIRQCNGECGYEDCGNSGNASTMAFKKIADSQKPTNHFSHDPTVLGAVLFLLLA